MHAAAHCHGLCSRPSADTRAPRRSLGRRAHPSRRPSPNMCTKSSPADKSPESKVNIARRSPEMMQQMMQSMRCAEARDGLIDAAVWRTEGARDVPKKRDPGHQ